MELKKNPSLDDRKKYALFFNIGLVLSLLAVITAFEWKVPEQQILVDLPGTVSFGPEISPPITEITPPKPKVQVFHLVEKKDDELIEKPKIDYQIVMGEPDVPDVPDDLFDEPADEPVDEIVSFAETMPSFEGGLSEFYKFVGTHLKYPAQARRMGIEGKVFVYFVVDKDGSLSDVKIVRGIGAGCDDEVLRIVGISPRWHPGKQRGVPVRVRMMLPITFKLQ